MVSSINSMKGGFCIIQIGADERGNSGKLELLEPKYFSCEHRAAESPILEKFLPQFEKWWFENSLNARVVDECGVLETTLLVSNQSVRVYVFRLRGENRDPLALLFNNDTELVDAEHRLDSMRAEMAELKRVDGQRKHLVRRIINAQESERRRIAREIHDQFGQQLSWLRMKLSVLRRNCEETTSGSEFDLIEEAVRQLDKDLQLLARELRPALLDDLGLVQALANLVDTWSKRVGIVAELDATGMDHRLSSELETVLYRVTQEALDNVAKHAQAKNVAVLLHCNATNVSLIVEDDGTGFDYKQQFGTGENGLGLIGMRERVELTGGALDVESRVGNGTTIMVRLPI